MSEIRSLLVSGVKVNCMVEIDNVLSQAQEIARIAVARFQREGIDDEPLSLLQRRDGRNHTHKRRTLPSEASDYSKKFA